MIRSNPTRQTMSALFSARKRKSSSFVFRIILPFINFAMSFLRKKLFPRADRFIFQKGPASPGWKIFRCNAVTATWKSNFQQSVVFSSFFVLLF